MKQAKMKILAETFIELDHPMTKVERMIREFFNLTTGFEVRYYGSGLVQNDGIGGYEFWGAKCFDHGTDFLEFDEIEIDKDGLTEKEVSIATKYLEDNFDKIHQLLEDDASDNWIEEDPEPPEPDYDTSREEAYFRNKEDGINY